MNWSALVEVSLGLLGGAAGGLTLVAFLGGKLVDHQLRRALEAQRHELERIATAEAERLRGMVALQAQEHEILLSRLQDRRAEVIDQLYGKLVDAIREITEFVDVSQSVRGTSDDKAHRAADSYNEFIRYFDRKKIWLPVDCCGHVENLKREMISAFVLFDTFRSVSDDALDRVREQKLKAWLQAHTSVTESAVPPARAALERAMRRLLEPHAGS